MDIWPTGFALLSLKTAAVTALGEQPDYLKLEGKD